MKIIGIGGNVKVRTTGEQRKMDSKPEPWEKGKVDR